MLKPGGYERLEQIGQLFKAKEAAAFTGVSAEKVEAMVEAAKSDKHHVKAVKPVSYTHLDVYKRQGSANLASMIIAAITYGL